MTDSFAITRTIAASRELVWDAFTRPECFSLWFGTEAVEVPLEHLTLDVRVGGVLKAKMILPDGNTIDWLGEYTEVEPPARLCFTLTDVPGEDPGDPIVTVLTAVEDGTLVELTQPRGDFSDEQVAATVEGYNGFFDALENVVASMR